MVKLIRASAAAIFLLAAGICDRPAQASGDPLLAALHPFDLRAKANGVRYRIFVAVPDEKPPATGYPVFTMTDGNEGCPLAASIAKTLSAYILRKPLIVCVGYPTADPASIWTKRSHDLIDPPQQSFHGGAWPGLANAGGEAEFSEFLEHELKPVIARRYPVDASEQALFGHSLGGWFALHEFLVHPDRYSAFIAGSPSLFWNTAEIEALVRSARNSPATSRLLLEVGSREDAVDEAPPHKGLGIEYRMVDHFHEIARLLAQELPARSTARLIEGESHSSALAPELDHGLIFAFGRK